MLDAFVPSWWGNPYADWLVKSAGQWHRVRTYYFNYRGDEDGKRNINTTFCGLTLKDPPFKSRPADGFFAPVPDSWVDDRCPTCETKALQLGFA